MNPYSTHITSTNKFIVYITARILRRNNEETYTTIDTYTHNAIWADEVGDKGL
jgi:hypothetical protein